MLTSNQQRRVRVLGWCALLTAMLEDRPFSFVPSRSTHRAAQLELL